MSQKTYCNGVLETNISIERVDLKNKKTPWAIISIIQREFCPNEDLLEILKRYQELTKSDGLKVVSSDETSRGAEVYFLGRREKPLGVLDLRFYKFTIISPQLYLTEEIDEGERTSYLRLKRFGEIIDEGDKLDVVGEIAYYAIVEEERGKGFGRMLFEYGVNRIRKIIGGKGLLLVIAKTNLTNYENGRVITKYLLSREEEINGKDNQGRVIIKGILISTEDIRRSTGIDCVGFHRGRLNYPTSHLAISFGMKFICYSKNLSSVFVLYL